MRSVWVVGCCRGLWIVYCARSFNKILKKKGNTTIAILRVVCDNLSKLVWAIEEEIAHTQHVIVVAVQAWVCVGGGQTMSRRSGELNQPGWGHANRTRGRGTATNHGCDTTKTKSKTGSRAMRLARLLRMRASWGRHRGRGGCASRAGAQCRIGW